ncbi:MAG: site-specific integrase [Balneolales bacterium]
MTTSFHFYLRKDFQKKNGEYPIYLRITHNRKHKYMSTGVSVLDKHWNPEKEIIRKNHRNASVLNETLSNKISQVQKVQSELEKNGSESAKAIRERMQSRQKADFFVLADNVLMDIKKAGKHYPYKNTKVAFDKLETFEGERVLPLKNIDTAYLEKFERHLIVDKKNGPNTISKNFGAIRKVIRMGLKSNLLSVDPFLYFEGAKRKKSAGKTKLSIEQIRGIEALKLNVDSWLWNARNAFLFSFYSGGIRFGDICCLKWSNIANDRLTYQMNKNNKGFSTQLNDHQKEILSRYPGEENDFIFPFLDSDNPYTDPAELRKEISSKNALINKNLKKLVEVLNKKVEEKELVAPKITESVSFHVSRHSFAQHAVESGLDLYELMQTLRHSKLETTQKYLKGLDEELADKAMKKVF